MNIANISQLRTKLLEALVWVKTDPKRVAQCKEISNTAGKVIATVRTELEYAKLRAEKPEVPFLVYRKS